MLIVREISRSAFPPKHMKFLPFRFLAFCLSIGGVAMADSVPFKLIPERTHDLQLEAQGDGSWKIRSTGKDPFLYTDVASPAITAGEKHLLSFEYLSPTGTDTTQVYGIPKTTEANSVRSGGLAKSAAWTSFAIDVQNILNQQKGSISQLRLDFGSKPDSEVQVRNLVLRSENEAELKFKAEAAAEVAKQKAHTEKLKAYLNATFPAEVSQVTVAQGQVTIAGLAKGLPGTLFLAEIPLYMEVTDAVKPVFEQELRPDAAGKFTVSLERLRKAGELTHDRLLSRWAVVSHEQNGIKLQSAAHYADVVVSQQDLPLEPLRNKKGLGGFAGDRPISDLDDLGVACVTMNVVLSGILNSEPGENRTPWNYNGRTWYASNRRVAEMDRLLKETAKRHIVVSAIILISQPTGSPKGSFNQLITYPGALRDGIYVMPNVAEEEGMEAYAAGMDFLASRYSRPDEMYGRIHHWIMHNEVNAGWMWTNAGKKSVLAYTDLYYRSIRLAHLIARQYDPNAKAFISLDHHWMSPNDEIYGGREVLEGLLAFSHREGDFEWGVAHHPYPEDLAKPDVWTNAHVTYSYDTPKITFKNLEVLDAWLRLPNVQFQGRPRVAHLSEQGLNSPDYSEASLKAQAAGMAFAWNKYKHLSTIEAFQYHNWVDNRHEGNLRIGLRRFPDDETEPLGKKPIWYVFQAMQTPNEDAVLKPYLEVVGVKEWAEVIYRGAVK